jgi:hypothetical protein
VPHGAGKGGSEIPKRLDSGRNHPWITFRRITQYDLADFIDRHSEGDITPDSACNASSG